MNLKAQAVDKKILYYSGSRLNNNEKSLVMRLSGARTKKTMLFMGDFEGKAPLQALLGHGVNTELKSTLKAARF